MTTTFNAVQSGNKILGHIVCWTSSGVVSVERLRTALAEAGLDPALSKDLLPRHGFARAVKDLTSAGMFRHLGETQHTITFQVTTETKVDDKFEYNFAAKLVLDKKAGTVTSEEDPFLAAVAEALVTEKVNLRNAHDQTFTVQKIFRKARNADLFAVRDSGGVYFVAATAKETLDKVAAFAERIGIKMFLFPIMEGSSVGNQSVTAVVREGCAGMVKELRDGINEFTSETRTATLVAAEEKIRGMAFKIDIYAEYLQDTAAELRAELEAAKQDLSEKIAAEAAA